MKKLKREVMNAISNFEIKVSLGDYSTSKNCMSKKDFKKYKAKYNEELQVATRKVLVLFWNAVGGLI